jgi:hypothetical protein
VWVTCLRRACIALGVWNLEEACALKVARNPNDYNGVVLDRLCCVEVFYAAPLGVSSRYRICLIP